MALKKSYSAAYDKDEKLIREQRDVDMHPLEEDAIKKQWAIHEINMKIPQRPTLELEHEWLIENGSEYVKLKRQEWQKIYNDIQPELLDAHNKHNEAHAIWCKHADICLSHKLDYDTYDGNAADKLTLKLPIEEK